MLQIIKYSCCGGPIASGGHQPHCPILKMTPKPMTKKKKEYNFIGKGKDIHSEIDQQLKAKGIKEKIIELTKNNFQTTMPNEAEDFADQILEILAQEKQKALAEQIKEIEKEKSRLWKEGTMEGDNEEVVGYRNGLDKAIKIIKNNN